MADVATHNEEQFEDDPDLSPVALARRRYSRWKIELDAARKEMANFRKDAREAVAHFSVERSATETEYNINDNVLRRLNVFSSDTQVKRDELFGNVPKVDVSRRYGDSRDQAARLAGVLMQRVLNSDIEHDERNYCTTMERALFDVLTPGLGFAMARYVPPDEERGLPEDVETYYVHWSDALWSPCRVWEERRWVAVGGEMSRQDLLDNFALSLGEVLLSQDREPPAEEQDEMVSEGPEGEAAEAGSSSEMEEWHQEALARGREAIKSIPLDAQRGLGRAAGKAENESQDKAKQNWPWDRAYVWEIWDLERRQVTRLVEGFDLVLECVEDPLELKSFFPFPEPMMANLTNDKCVPMSDWKLAKGLYEEADTLTARISSLTRACRIAGGYDKTCMEIGRIFDEAEENRLVPVDNWAMFAEKGGLKGKIDLVPLDQITNTLQVLTQQRLNTLDLLRQITGMADIMRGQQQENGTPGEAEIKYKAASVRMRAWQKRFARFASDLQAIKMEIISKKFSDDTILKRANAEYLEDMAPPAAQPLPKPPQQPQQGPPQPGQPPAPPPDPVQQQMAARQQAMQARVQQAQAQMAAQAAEAQKQQLLQAAVALIRDKFHEYRIQVKPESIAAEDFATMRAERTEFVQQMSGLVDKLSGYAQSMPIIIPGMLQVAKWAAQGLKGGKEIEGVFDEMIDAVGKQIQSQAANPQQNPQDAQAKARLVEVQAKAAADSARIDKETQADLVRSRAEAQNAAELAEQKAQLDLRLAQEKERLRIEGAAAQDRRREEMLRGPVMPKGTPAG